MNSLSILETLHHNHNGNTKYITRGRYRSNCYKTIIRNDDDKTRTNRHMDKPTSKHMYKNRGFLIFMSSKCWAGLIRFSRLLTTYMIFFSTSNYYLQVLFFFLYDTKLKKKRDPPQKNYECFFYREP